MRQYISKEEYKKEGIDYTRNELIKLGIYDDHIASINGTFHQFIYQMMKISQSMLHCLFFSFKYLQLLLVPLLVFLLLYIITQQQQQQHVDHDCYLIIPQQQQVEEQAANYNMY